MIVSNKITLNTSTPTLVYETPAGGSASSVRYIVGDTE